MRLSMEKGGASKLSSSARKPKRPGGTMDSGGGGGKSSVRKERPLIAARARPAPQQQQKTKKSRAKGTGKGKKGADDNTPHRPLSAYNLFFREERNRMVEARERGELPPEAFSTMAKLVRNLFFNRRLFLSSFQLPTPRLVSSSLLCSLLRLPLLTHT